MAMPQFIKDSLCPTFMHALLVAPCIAQLALVAGCGVMNLFKIIHFRIHEQAWMLA